MSSTIEIAALFGNLADDIMPHLQGKLVEIRRGMRDLALAHDGDLGGWVCPAPLHPYQRAGIAFGDEVRRALIGYGMGLGKSRIAAALIVKNQAFPAAVTCPPNLTLNWKRELLLVDPSLRVEILSGQEGGELPEADVYVIGDSILGDRPRTAKRAAVRGWGHVLAAASLRALVVDESQRMKNRKAQRTIAALEISRKIDDEGLVILLSGTPLKSRALELLEQFEIMGVTDQIWGDKFAFMDRFAPKLDDYGTRGDECLDELHAEMTDTVVARLQFEDVAYQLGDAAPKGVLRVPVATPLDGPAAARYEAKLVELAKLRKASREGKGVPKGAILKIYGELRSLIARAKLPAVVEHVANLVEEGDQVIVFAHHREIVELLAKTFKAHTIMGGMKVADVELAKERFQAGADRVIVANLAAGGTGHTLTAAKHVVFAELGQTPDEMTQAEARANRLGQTSLVLSHWMMGANGRETFDDRTALSLNSKQAVVSTVLDGGATKLLDEGAEPMTIEEALAAWNLEDLEV